MNTIQNLAKYKPAPYTSAARRETDWSRMTNKALAYALTQLELHHSPYVNDVLSEIQQRASKGIWLDLEKPPPPLHNMPIWLTIWPFCLLWRQRG